MEQKEITTLKLMESLDREPKQTQRELARELNISLGLVNSFIKRLVKKGFFKVKTISKNRVKYILTPKGIYEKTKLTYSYIIYTLEYYKETRTRVKSICEHLQLQGKKRVFIVGTGELAEIVFISLHSSQLKSAGVIDCMKVGEKFIGTTILALSSIKEVSSDDAVIITNANVDSGKLKLLSSIFSNTNIVKLL